MFTPTAPYIPTATSTGSTAQLRADVLSLKQSRAIADLLLGSPTSTATPLEIVDRDSNGSAALYGLDVQNITHSGDITMTCQNLNLNAVNVLCAQGAQPTSVTNKTYVDQAVQNAMAGLSWKNPVRLKTVAALPAYTSTGTVALETYTATANGALTIDSVAVAVGDRILLDQSNIAADGGIFTVVSAGSPSAKWVLQRAQDANNDPGVEVTSGMGMCVTEGTTAGGKQYVLTTADPIVLGTTPLNFALFSTGTQTLSGEVTGTTGAADLSNSAVIGKVLTGFASTTGSITPVDTLLSFANKTAGNVTALQTTVGMPTNLNTASQIVKRDASGNFTAGTITANLTGTASTVVTNANLTGEVTSIGNATTMTTAAVIGKLLTGYASTTGTITASDSILTAIAKLNGNSTYAVNGSGAISCGTLAAGGLTTLSNGLASNGNVSSRHESNDDHY